MYMTLFPFNAFYYYIQFLKRTRKRNIFSLAYSFDEVFDFLEAYWKCCLPNIFWPVVFPKTLLLVYSFTGFTLCNFGTIFGTIERPFQGWARRRDKNVTFVCPSLKSFEVYTNRVNYPVIFAVISIFHSKPAIFGMTMCFNNKLCY